MLTDPAHRARGSVEAEVQAVPDRPQVTIVGGGMITQIQLLPTIYHMQRQGELGEIHICALNSPPIQALQDDAALARAFPGQRFVPHPDPAKVAAQEKFPDGYRQVLAKAPPAASPWWRCPTRCTTRCSWRP